MTIEVIQYNFEEHSEQYQPFFTKVMKLLIISKLNCLETNRLSVQYFHKLVSRIDGCSFHSIKYGKPMVFTKFLGYDFNYHTVRVTMRTVENFSIEISIESIIKEFVKVFDELSSNTTEIKWNVTASSDRINVSMSPSISVEQSTDGRKLSGSVAPEEEDTYDEEKITFNLLDSFIGSLYMLMNLSRPDVNSLFGKNIEIKDVSLTRKILNIEIIVDDETIILDFNTKARNKVLVSLDNNAKNGETIKNLMLQNDVR
ncbi:MAG TPA: hypothetical protein VLE21_05345 [Candidatus Nitrosocosmicus sp.]|nr:hypothetical protein [Candidatus Nitrosocosmicus sp.]